MARPVFATMLPLILVPFLLFQVRDCSARALLRPTEHQQPLAPAAHHRDEPPYHPDDDAAETGARPVAIAEDDDGQSSARADGDGAAPWSSMATASSPRDKDQGVVGSRHGSTLLAGPPVLQRSKLARRFLAVAGVVEGADSAARASCHSSDVHNGCTPPSEH
ncbi:hypothetical protein SEVIR_9G115900v4 [Setaria viridis]|uniref:Uncharacterized protein n=1 Tax=Setaria viridis TaxID=4556 RepID=A0A4U6SSB1_SETVI|nr:hypothetical protein SEVIR_9G115900v2 [Setaria viridis]